MEKINCKKIIPTAEKFFIKTLEGMVFTPKIQVVGFTRYFSKVLSNEIRNPRQVCGVTYLVVEKVTCRPENVLVQVGEQLLLKRAACW